MAKQTAHETLDMRRRALALVWHVVMSGSIGNASITLFAPAPTAGVRSDLHFGVSDLIERAIKAGLLDDYLPRISGD